LIRSICTSIISFYTTGYGFRIALMDSTDKNYINLKNPDQWDAWYYDVRNILEKYDILDLISDDAAVRGIALGERPDPAVYGGGGAMTTRQSKAFDALSAIFEDKQKGLRKIADYVHRSTFEHQISVVRDIGRNDIYGRFVALRAHLNPISSIAIRNRLDACLHIKQSAPTRLAAQEFVSKVNQNVAEIVRSCIAAGVTLEDVIRQICLVKGTFVQAQQLYTLQTSIAANPAMTLAQISASIISVSEYVEAEGPNYARSGHASTASGEDTGSAYAVGGSAKGNGQKKSLPCTTCGLPGHSAQGC